METYFDHITEDLKLYTLLKLKYDEYIKSTHDFVKVLDVSVESLVRLKDPAVWKKVKRVMQRNTELKFSRYTNRDTYIWGIIFIDLMNGLKTSPSLENGIPNLIWFEEEDTEKYNSVSIELLSLYEILSNYPKIYKHVGRYLKFSRGAYFFFDAIIKALELTLSGNRVFKIKSFGIPNDVNAVNFFQKFKIFVETGDVDRIIMPSNFPNASPSTNELRVIMMAHILLSSLPKSKVSINPNFTGDMEQFTELILNTGNGSAYLEYLTYMNFYHEIMREVPQLI